MISSRFVVPVRLPRQFNLGGKALTRAFQGGSFTNQASRERFQYNPAREPLRGNNWECTRNSDTFLCRSLRPRSRNLLSSIAICTGSKEKRPIEACCCRVSDTSSVLRFKHRRWGRSSRTCRKPDE